MFQGQTIKRRSLETDREVTYQHRFKQEHVVTAFRNRHAVDLNCNLSRRRQDVDALIWILRMNIYWLILFEPRIYNCESEPLANGRCARSKVSWQMNTEAVFTSIKIRTQTIHLKSYQAFQRTLLENQHAIIGPPLTLQVRLVCTIATLNSFIIDRQQSSFDCIFGDVVKRIVRVLPNMPRLSGVEDILLIEKPPDAARCLLDLLRWIAFKLRRYGRQAGWWRLFRVESGRWR